MGSFVQIEEDDLRRLYVDEGQSLSQIATRFGTNVSAVRNQMVEYGIPRRPALRIRPGVMRKVVRQEIRPIGTNRIGDVEEISVDILECGHITQGLKRQVLLGSVAEGEWDLDEWIQSDTRQCKPCTAAQKGDQ